MTEQNEQQEQALDSVALSFALFTLVSLPGCACSYFGSLYFTGHSARFGVIVAFARYLAASLLLLLFMKPHSSMNQKIRLRRTGKWSLVLTLASLALILLLSLAKDQIEFDALKSVLLGLATWSAGYFGGLAIITLGSRHLWGIHTFDFPHSVGE